MTDVPRAPRAGASIRPRSALLAVTSCVVLAACLSLVFSASAEEPPPPPVADVPVDWAERPDSVGELVENAVVVAEAEVVAIEAGDPLVSLDPSDPGGAASEIPTLEVTFATISEIDGEIASTFTVEKTGSEYRHLEGDPAYVIGERYVLFLRPKADDPSLWLVTSPDGRILLEDTAPADPAPESAALFIEGEVKEEFEGATLAEIADEITEAVR